MVSIFYQVFHNWKAAAVQESREWNEHSLVQVTSETTDAQKNERLR